MDKHEALDWFLRRKSMYLDDKCQAAEDIAIECIMRASDGDWIRVEDRLPEYDKEVLIHAVSKTTNESKIAISYLMDKFYFGSRPINLKEPIWHEPWQYFGANNTITHWMPLPEPPKEET